MHPATGFPLFLGLTVGLLIADVVTGRRGALRTHLSCVALTFVCLGVTIYFAEGLGELYDLEAAGAITPVHLTLAKLTTAAYLLMVVTGVRTLRDRSRRRAHRLAAVVVLTMTVVTAVTGAAMLARSPRIEPGQPGVLGARD